MVNNKRQHWIPASYLEAWADPDTPAGQTPYVHVFDRYGGDHRRKSPANIFKKADLYSIFDGCERDLRIEQTFGRWEADFVRVRGSIAAQKFGIGDDHADAVAEADLYTFVGAMLARPPHRIDHVNKQWASIAQRMRTMRINPNMAPIPTLSTGPSMTLAQVQELADNPMGTWFPELVGSYAKVLWSLFGCEILINDSEDLFLTSDAPAVICHLPGRDPHSGIFPRGLGSPGCEITLAISPQIALHFRHGEPGVNAIVNVNRLCVLEINFRTITRARLSIVSDRPDIFFVEAITQHLAACDATRTADNA